MPGNLFRTTLWFNGDHDPKEAAEFYCSVFPDSKITFTDHFTEVGKEVHGHEAGEICTIHFTLNGNPFNILNGGKHPNAAYSDAVSFQVDCADQATLDDYHAKLTADGGEGRDCGWVTDKYGVRWQLIPRALDKYLKEGSKEQVKRVWGAMMGMEKLDVEAFDKAYEGK